MTRSDLINRLCQLHPEMDHQLIEGAVSIFFLEIVSTLQRDDRVELRGLGSFCLRKREKRMARNPKTGEPVPVEKKWIPFFKAGKKLRVAINQKSSS